MKTKLSPFYRELLENYTACMSDLLSGTLTMEALDFAIERFNDRSAEDFTPQNLNDGWDAGLIGPFSEPETLQVRIYTIYKISKIEGGFAITKTLQAIKELKEIVGKL